jgi:hypothetical protein
MCNKLRYQNISTQAYQSQQKITLDDFCNSVSIKNAGNTIVMFNNEPIFPGESKSIGGIENGILTGRYNLTFTTIWPGFVVPVTPFNSAFFTQIYYIPTPKGYKTDLE